MCASMGQERRKTGEKATLAMHHRIQVLAKRNKGEGTGRMGEGREREGEGDRVGGCHKLHQRCPCAHPWDKREGKREKRGDTSYAPPHPSARHAEQRGRSRENGRGKGGRAREKRERQEGKWTDLMALSPLRYRGVASRRCSSRASPVSAAPGVPQDIRQHPLQEDRKARGYGVQSG